MTQKELIDHCNTYYGECLDCLHRDACGRYWHKYSSSPFRDDVLRRERYADEEI